MYRLCPVRLKKKMKLRRGQGTVNRHFKKGPSIKINVRTISMIV